MATREILSHIIFEHEDKIDWGRANRIITTYKPELKAELDGNYANGKDTAFEEKLANAWGRSGNNVIYSSGKQDYVKE